MKIRTMLEDFTHFLHHASHGIIKTKKETIYITIIIVLFVILVLSMLFRAIFI